MRSTLGALGALGALTDASLVGFSDEATGSYSASYDALGRLTGATGRRVAAGGAASTL